MHGRYYTRFPGLNLKNAVTGLQAHCKHYQPGSFFPLPLKKNVLSFENQRKRQDCGLLVGIIAGESDPPIERGCPLRTNPPVKGNPESLRDS
ncbi:MAG: hypothetical protein CSA81_10710 [Acidobacteria bacterium]|nr:MAG: hypothetical protein CSA81_10710 [Acidobacteriota bacterium]